MYLKLCSHFTEERSSFKKLIFPLILKKSIRTSKNEVGILASIFSPICLNAERMILLMWDNSKLLVFDKYN